jgi:hypothetical protein
MNILLHVIFKMTLPSVSTKVKIMLAILVVLLAALLAWFLQDLACKLIVVPILYILWQADIALRIIPQPVIWIIFTIVGAIILMKSFVSPKKSRKKIWKTAKRYPGRVKELAKLIHFAQKWNYSRWNLAHYLAGLASEILAFREQCPREQILEQLENGTLKASQDVRKYFQTGIQKKGIRRNNFFSNLRQGLRSQEQSSSLEFDLENAIRFLENQLEGHYDDEND